jgi:squalene synthase HpnC
LTPALGSYNIDDRLVSLVVRSRDDVMTAGVDDDGPALAHVRSSDLTSRARGENFPVALRLLRARTRRHLMAIYGFARLCDELGDSFPGDRLAALDRLDAEIGRAFAGTSDDPVLQAVGDTARELSLPAQPFHDLVAANRQDQVVHDYGTLTELLGYCELSANPVGRLVLAVFGVSTPERVALSDRVCSGLQLVEHWQDVGEDAAAGRVYLPGDDRWRFGVDRSDLSAASAPAALRTLLRFECARARALLDAGRPLVAGLRGEARVAVAGYVAGGFAALDAIAAVDFDVLGAPTGPRPVRIAVHALALLVAPGASRWRS